MQSNESSQGKPTSKPFKEWKLPENWERVSRLNGRTISIIGNVKPASASGEEPDPPTSTTPPKPETPAENGPQEAEPQNNPPQSQPNPKALSMVEPENEEDESPEEYSRAEI